MNSARLGAPVTVGESGGTRVPRVPWGVPPQGSRLRRLDASHDLAGHFCPEGLGVGLWVNGEAKIAVRGLRRSVIQHKAEVRC